MIKGIIESERKNIGLVESEYKAFPDFKERHQRAVNIVTALQQTDIILDLRNLANTVYKLTKDDFFLHGPSGHSYIYGYFKGVPLCLFILPPVVRNYPSCFSILTIPREP
uniref:Uncharacterized protein n=1 Tax=Phlegmariurus squarrosus TaxID=73615 RepID=H9M846_PHLSQ|nr:hypothetical protein HusqMp45 [Phlegmariurus squarrosus]AEV55753.1 hypothetical protein HusqMp45 [Phlegmariurus squarrosus]